MFVETPLRPLVEAPAALDNATLARRALLDLNATLAERGMPAAPHWSPDAVRGGGWRNCLVGATVGHAGVALCCWFRSPFVHEIEARFEDRVDYEGPTITAAEAAEATGSWRLAAAAASERAI